MVLADSTELVYMPEVSPVVRWEKQSFPGTSIREESHSLLSHDE